jgi:hypothetical protein
MSEILHGRNHLVFMCKRYPQGTRAQGMPKGGQTVNQGKVPVPTVRGGGNIERWREVHWDERGALLRGQC